MKISKKKLVLLGMFCLIGSLAFVSANPISNQEDIVSYDLIEDLYFLNGDLANETAYLDFADINATSYAVDESQVNHTIVFAGDMTDFVTGEMQDVEFFWSAWYFFPANFTTVDTNATIICYYFQNGDLGDVYVFYMNYTEYLTFEWLSYHSATYNRTVVAEEVPAYHQNQTSVVFSDAYWNITAESSIQEQFTAYSIVPNYDHPQYTMFDFFPEIGEYTGTGINPIFDASLVSEAWETIYGAFFPSEDPDDQTTTTTTAQLPSGGSGSGDDEEETTTPDTIFTDPNFWIYLIIALIVFLFIVVLFLMVTFSGSLKPQKKKKKKSVTHRTYKPYKRTKAKTRRKSKRK